MPPRGRRRSQPSDQDQQHRYSFANNQPWALPTEVLITIFSLLEHDDLFNCLSICKAWHTARDADLLWAQQCLLHSWDLDQGSEPETWQDAYKRHYKLSCSDCFTPCERKTLSFGPLVVRLCRACSRGYAERQPGQRLIPKTQAKQHWCLSDSDLQHVRYCIEPNPINPAFSSMHLYRITDIRSAALRKFGTVEAVDKERRRRLTRR